VADLGINRGILDVNSVYFLALVMVLKGVYFVTPSSPWLLLVCQINMLQK
jgi:hypothetical protein